MESCTSTKTTTIIGWRLTSKQLSVRDIMTECGSIFYLPTLNKYLYVAIYGSKYY